MIDILYIDVPNEYVSRTDALLFVAQIVRTANEMSSTDNTTPTNKSFNNNNNKTNKDMNKQLIQDVIKAGNKAIDSVPVKYTVETKVENYQVYNGIYYDDNHIEFVDDYDDEVYLEYDKVVGIKVSEI